MSIGTQTAPLSGHSINISISGLDETDRFAAVSAPALGTKVVKRCERAPWRKVVSRTHTRGPSAGRSAVKLPVSGLNDAGS